MKKFTFDIDCFSDLYKDVTGHRPLANHPFYDDEFTTDKERQNWWDYLCCELEATIESEKLAEEKAGKEFEILITETINNGAGDRKTAIKWILSGLEITEDDVMYGFGYVQYLLNISNEYTEEIENVLNKLFTEDVI